MAVAESGGLIAFYVCNLKEDGKSKGLVAYVPAAFLPISPSRMAV